MCYSVSQIDYIQLLLSHVHASCSTKQGGWVGSDIIAFMSHVFLKNRESLHVGPKCLKTGWKSRYPPAEQEKTSEEEQKRTFQRSHLQSGTFWLLVCFKDVWEPERVMDTTYSAVIWSTLIKFVYFLLCDYTSPILQSFSAVLTRHF